MNADYIFLSIIIPVFNVERYIEECLKSVFSQELSNCEVICVNDGSTDNSRNILDDFKNQYPNLKIIDRQNGGLSAARNSGLEIAKGEYVYFLDSDDYLYSGVVLKIKDIINKNKPQIAVFNALVNGERKYTLGLETISNTCMTGIQYFQKSFSCIRTVSVPIWLHVYRKDFLKKNNLQFDVGLYYEDELFTPRALYVCENIIYCDFPLIYYRFNREGAISSNFTEKHLLDRKIIINKLFNYYSNTNCLIDEFYRKIFEFFIVTFEVMIQKKSTLDINKFFGESEFEIFRMCAKIDFEKKCLRLFSINTKLMLSYRNNTINPILRKLINRFL